MTAQHINSQHFAVTDFPYPLYKNFSGPSFKCIQQ